MKWSSVLACALLVALCGSAQADEMPSEETTLPAPETAEPVLAPPEAKAETLPAYAPYNGRTAIDAWDDARGYRYGTQMLFPLTRGMEEAGIRGWARYPVGVFTVPFDLALLPTGAIAGLFGG